MNIEDKKSATSVKSGAVLSFVPIVEKQTQTLSAVEDPDNGGLSKAYIVESDKTAYRVCNRCGG